MKRTSIGYVTAAGYPELARHARVLATYEGFDAHANAVSGIRDELLAGGTLKSARRASTSALRA